MSFVVLRICHTCKKDELTCKCPPPTCDGTGFVSIPDAAMFFGWRTERCPGCIKCKKETP